LLILCIALFACDKEGKIAIKKYDSGKVKTDNGKIRMNNYNRPKLENNKSKVNY